MYPIILVNEETRAGMSGLSCEDIGHTRPPLPQTAWYFNRVTKNEVHCPKPLECHIHCVL